MISTSFVTVANGEDDFGLSIDFHQVLIDVTAGGVDRGKITRRRSYIKSPRDLGFFRGQMQIGFQKIRK